MNTDGPERHLGAVQWSFVLFGTVQSDAPATAVVTGCNRREPSSAWYRRMGDISPSPKPARKGQGDEHRDDQADHQRDEADVDLHRRPGERVPAWQRELVERERRTAEVRLPLAGFGMSQSR
jgi:hypothetical protein